MGAELSRCVMIPIGSEKSGEVYLTGFPHARPRILCVDGPDPVRCSVAGQILKVEVMGDNHSICARGRNMEIYVRGNHTRLRVDGQRVKVIVEGEGTILYTNSNDVSLEGPFQLSRRGDLTAPDCPKVLPSWQGHALTQEYCENNLFLNVIYTTEPRNDPEDDPGNRADEEGDAGGNNNADDAGGNNIQDPATGSGQESDGEADEDTLPTSNAANSGDRNNVLANDANICVLNKINLNTGSKKRKRTNSEADVRRIEWEV